MGFLSDVDYKLSFRLLVYNNDCLTVLEVLPYVMAALFLLHEKRDVKSAD